MSSAAKRGPPTSGRSSRNWRPTLASHRPADCGPSWMLESVVSDEVRRQPLSECLGLGLVLDVGRRGAGADEGDVRDGAAGAAGLRIRIDAEIFGAGVRGFADDVGRTGVAEDGPLELALINDRRHIAARS